MKKPQSREDAAMRPARRRNGGREREMTIRKCGVTTQRQ